MSNELLKFPYKISAMRAVTMVIIAIAISVSLAYLALTNINGLRIFKILTLTHEEATIFLWALSFLCLLALMVVIFVSMHSFKAPRDLLLDNTHMIVPKASLSNEFITIPYASIHQAGLQLVGRQKMFIIKSSEGDSWLHPQGFQNAAEFERFQHAFAERVRG